MQFLLTVCLRVLYNNHLIIYPLPKLPPDPYFPYPPNSVSVFVCMFWSPICDAIDWWMCTCSLEKSTYQWWHSLKKTCSPFPRNYQLPTAPKLVRVRLPSQMVGFDRVWTCIGPANAVMTPWVHLCDGPVVSIWHCLLVFIYILWFSEPLHPLFHMLLSLGRRMCGRDVPFRPENSIGFCSLTHVYGSVLIALYCK